VFIGYSNTATAVRAALAGSGASSFKIWTAAGAAVTNAVMSTGSINGGCVYPVS
jgi:hypothetical protein